MEAAVRGASVTELPAEVVLHVMSFLTPVDLVRAEAVNHELAHLIQLDQPTWRTVYQTAFGGPQAGKDTWRTQCVRAAKRVRQIVARADLTPEARTLDLLRWACACGHHRFCAQLFADNRIGPDSLDLEASSVYPLHMAVISGSAETVEVLLRAGFDVQRRNAQGATAIGLAAQKGLLDLVELLLRYGASTGEIGKLEGTQQKKAKGKNAIPLLHQAAAGGHTKIVQALIERAATGEDKDKLREFLDMPDGRTGHTPIHHAVEKGREKTVRFLLDRGADVNRINEVSGVSPLHLAVLQRNAPMVRLLLEHGAKNTCAQRPGKGMLVSPFHMACEHQLADVVDAFLELGGAHIELPDFSGRTPLMLAVGHLRCEKAFVEHLLAKGADPRATVAGTDVLESVLRAGITKEKVEVMSALIDLIGAPMEHRADLLERAAAHVSMKYDDPCEAELAMVDLLLAKGVVMPSRDTGCMAHAASSNPAVIQFFLDRGVHIDAREPGERPGLQELIARNDPERREIVRNLQFFLEKGADPNAGGWDGRPACFLAYTNPDLLDLLVKYGADLNHTNNDGMTALFHLLVHRTYWENGNPEQFAKCAEMARHLIRRGADPKKCVVTEGLDPYRWLLRYAEEPLRGITPEWLALVAELGVPIDTESPPPPNVFSSSSTTDDGGGDGGGDDSSAPETPTTEN